MVDPRRACSCQRLSPSRGQWRGANRRRRQARARLAQLVARVNNHERGGRRTRSAAADRLRRKLVRAPFPSVFPFPPSQTPSFLARSDYEVKQEYRGKCDHDCDINDDDDDDKASCDDSCGNWALELVCDGLWGCEGRNCDESWFVTRPSSLCPCLTREPRSFLPAATKRLISPVTTTVTLGVIGGTLTVTVPAKNPATLALLAVTAIVTGVRAALRRALTIR